MAIDDCFRITRCRRRFLRLGAFTTGRGPLCGASTNAGDEPSALRKGAGRIAIVRRPSGGRRVAAMGCLTYPARRMPPGLPLGPRLALGLAATGHEELGSPRASGKRVKPAKGGPPKHVCSRTAPICDPLQG